MVFVLDTSSFRVIENYYPDRFPSFWTLFDAAVYAGTIISVREVLRELGAQARSAHLPAWIKGNHSMFLTPTPDETLFVADIFRVPHFQALIGETQRLRGTPVADPFVVASARVRNGCVVTEEGSKPNAAKIPNVCDHFGVAWTNLEALLQRQGWVF